MRVWKIVGLAGLAGVAATGVLVVRAERRRAAYTPEQVRDRLHARYAVAAQESYDAVGTRVQPTPRPTLWQRLRALLARG